MVEVDFLFELVNGKEIVCQKCNERVSFALNLIRAILGVILRSIQGFGGMR